MVMDMEKTVMSPVFWRRLTYMRKHAAAHAAEFGEHDDSLQVCFQGRSGVVASM